MANQRQSSDRGCTQRGAYRRDFVLKVSQIVCGFAFVCALFAPARSEAVAVNNLVFGSTFSHTFPLCPSTSAAPFTFTIAGQLDAPTSSTTPYNVQLWVVPLALGTASCPQSPTGGQSINSNIGNAIGNGAAQITFNLTQATFNNPTVNSLCALVNTASTNNNGWALCAYVLDFTNPNQPTFIAPQQQPPILFAGSGSSTTATAVLSASDALPGDGQISFTVSTNTAYNSFEVCFTTNQTLRANLEASSDCTGFSLAGTSYGSSSASTTSGTFTGIWSQIDGAPLVNGTTTYYFKVRGIGGGSLWSDVLEATPVIGRSTLELYNAPGGGLSWKCTQTPGAGSLGSLLSLIALFSAVFLISPSRRRKLFRTLPIAFSFLVLLTLGGSASGSFNLGVIGAPYRPDLDPPSPAFPVYKCLYDDAVTPQLGAALDFHVSDPFGSIQLGLSASYSWANGKALAALPAQNNCTGLNFLPGATVGIQTLHLRPRLTYVFDPYVETFPIAPFVRVGMVATGYYFTYQGNADTRGQAAGRDPLGVRFGYEAGAGLMLMLDFIEPGISSRARASGVYNHTYLTAEAIYSSINDFGSVGYDFSPAGAFGSDLPVLFMFGLVVEFQ